MIKRLLDSDWFWFVSHVVGAVALTVGPLLLVCWLKGELWFQI